MQFVKGQKVRVNCEQCPSWEYHRVHEWHGRILTVEGRLEDEKFGEEGRIECELDERGLAPMCPPSQLRPLVEVGSRWQGIPGGGWEGRIATVAACEPLDEEGGTVDVQYEEGGSDSLPSERFLGAFELMAGC